MYEAPLARRNTGLLVALLIGLGLLWFCLLPLLRAGLGHKLLFLCLVLGLGMRLIQWAAPPVFEDDYYRYLWDGAVTAHGLNPYANTPAKAQAEGDLLGLWRQFPQTRPADTRLAELAVDSDEVIGRVAYPGIGTIYPPLAQAGFAAAHLISPFSLTAWRAVSLLAECLALWLLWCLLRHLGDGPEWLLLYWWNPMAWFQLANAAHMESLLLPPLMLAVLLAARGQRLQSACWIAAAAAVKLWPLMLVASLAAGNGLRRTLAPIALAVGLGLLLLTPQLLFLTADDSGGRVYAQSWQTNAFIFQWLVTGWEGLLASAEQAAIAARLCVVAVIGILAVHLFRRQPEYAQQRLGGWLSLPAALVLLGPTGYPWYFLWLLPLLCVDRQPALLALTVLLPLYYFRFPLEARGETGLLQLTIALQFLPVLLWLGISWVRGRCRDV